MTDKTKYRFSSTQALIGIGLVIILLIGVMFTFLIWRNKEITITSNKHDLFFSMIDTSQLQESVTAHIGQQVNQVNSYLTVVSLVVALFGIFGTVVTIGMGINLSLKERDIMDDLEKAKQEAKDALTTIEKFKEAKQAAEGALETAKAAQQAAE